MATTASVHKFVLRCSHCSARALSKSVIADRVCPNCNRGHLIPVPIVEDAWSYSTADRRQGPAREDIRLGQIAKWARLVTPADLKEALAGQKLLARLGANVPRIGEILVRKQLITNEQLSALLRVQTIKSPDTDEDAFGKIALSNGLVSESSLEECITLQSKMILETGEAPLIGQLLLEKKYLTEAQVYAILRAQKQMRSGVLSKLSAESNVKRRDTTSAVAAVVSKSPHPIRDVLLAALGMAIVVAAIALWLFLFFGNAAATVTPLIGTCTNCGELSEIQAHSSKPIECPACENPSLYPSVTCSQCKQVLALDEDFAERKQCPKCSHTRFRRTQME